MPRLIKDFPVHIWCTNQEKCCNLTRAISEHTSIHRFSDQAGRRCWLIWASTAIIRHTVENGLLYHIKHQRSTTALISLHKGLFNVLGIIWQKGVFLLSAPFAIWPLFIWWNFYVFVSQWMERSNNIRESKDLHLPWKLICTKTTTQQTKTSPWHI